MVPKPRERGTFMGTDDGTVEPGPTLSHLARIHAALELVYDCLDHPGGLSPWQTDFLNSLVKQLHRGLTLSDKQTGVLARISQRLEGIPCDHEGEKS
jgi:hypothetical protein